MTAEGYGYEIINASVPGDTSSGGLARLPALLDSYSPVIVIIELGGNDGYLLVYRFHLTMGLYTPASLL